MALDKYTIKPLDTSLSDIKSSFTGAMSTPITSSKTTQMSGAVLPAGMSVNPATQSPYNQSTVNGPISTLQSTQMVDTSAPVTTKDISSSNTITPPTFQAGTSKTNDLTSLANQAVEEATVGVEQQKAQEAQTESPRSGAISKLLGLMGDLSGKGEATLAAQKEQGIADKMKVANDINSKMITTSRAYDKQLREIEKNAPGGLQSGVNAESQRIAKMRDEQLADLSIQKAVALGDLDIVETTIAAKYEPISEEIGNWEKMLNIYQNDMSESEKFEATNKLNAAKEEMNYKQGLQTALINDANQSGQSNIASEAMRLDPSSPSFQENLANLQAKVVSQRATGGELSTREQILLNNAQTKWSATDEASKTFRVAQDTANRVLQDPKNAQTQLSTLYQYVKMLDSNSAVREGEIGLANSTASFVNKFQKAYESVISGSSVGSNTAKLMANEAIALASAWEKESTRQKNNIIAGTKSFGLEDEMRNFISYADILNSGLDTSKTENVTLKAGDTGATSSGLKYTIE
jgi:hypothetical protein